MAERIAVQPGLKARMVERAREFRQEPTRSEAILWRALRGSRRGARFRRQQPIGPFIVDFFRPAHRLIIEVDGPVHMERLAPDKERQFLLEACGYRVLRFTSNQIERHLHDTVAEIDAALRAEPLPANSPPLPGRERGSGGEGR